MGGGKSAPAQTPVAAAPVQTQPAIQTTTTVAADPKALLGGGNGLLSTGAEKFNVDALEKKDKGVTAAKKGSRGLQIPVANTAAGGVSTGATQLPTTAASTGIQI